METNLYLREINLEYDGLLFDCVTKIFGQSTDRLISYSYIYRIKSEIPGFPNRGLSNCPCCILVIV